jgi:large subunit ribosomal protein L25
MPDTYVVEPRTVTGKKVSRLRREGVLPANIYGRNLPSVAVQLPYVQARDLMNAHGQNTLIEIQVAGEAAPRPVVVRQIEQNPVTRSLLHLDFYQVDLSRLMQAQIPIVLSGVAPAVARWGGVLVQDLDHVEVEALPSNLPERIVVSVTGLTALEQHLTLADVPSPRGVRILTPGDSTVVTVQRSRVEADVAAAAAVTSAAVAEAAAGAEAAASEAAENPAE